MASINSSIFLLTINVMIFTVYTIMQLKRTEQFGYVVIMIQEMMRELAKYFMTFGLIILVFFIGLRIMTQRLKKAEFSVA